MDMMVVEVEIDPEVLEAQRKAQLASLIQKLQESCDELIEAKQPIEDRMVADLLRYQGDNPDVVGKTKQNFAETQGEKLPESIGYTKARVDVGAERARDSAFPDHDQPWEISADPDEPDPSIVQDIPPEDVRKVLDARAEELSDKVQADLNRAKFAVKGRLAIDDAFKLGTGILYGPLMRSERKSRLVKSMQPVLDEMGQQVIGPDGKPQMNPVMMFNSVVDEFPDLEHVSPFDVVFDYGKRVEDCTRAFRPRLYTAEQLRKLIGQPGFDEVAIKELLEKKPEEDNKCFQSMRRRNGYLSLNEPLDDRYCVWQFDGILKKEELECMCSDDFNFEANEVDPVLVQIWFCQGVVLFKRPGLILDDNRLPYYVINYSSVDDTVWGVGLSWETRHADRLVREQQERIQFASDCASGWLTLYKSDLIKLPNATKSIRGPTLVPVHDMTVDLGNAMHSEAFPDTTQQLTAVMNRFIELGDEAISLPLIAQGAASTVAQTATGQAMLMNSNNVVQRRIAMNIDDNCIVPVVERFAKFRQLFSPSDDMMVDFTVAARGMTNLIRDIQANKLMQAKAMIDADPDLKILLKPDVWLREVSRTMGIPLDAMWRSDDEVAEIQSKQQPPVDPTIEVTKMRVASAEKIADLNAQVKQAEMDARIHIAELGRATAELQLAADENLTLAQIRAKTDYTALQEQTKRLQNQAVIRLKAEDIVSKERLQAQEIRLKLSPANPTNQGI